MIDILIVALTWFALGAGLTALAFNIGFDKEKKKIFKDLQEVLSRNEELIQQNKRLIAYTNDVSNRFKDIHNEIEFLASLFKN